jgi:hypothetical protein
LFTKPTNQSADVFRHAFLDDVVVQRAKLLPDAGLHFAPQADFPFWLNGWRVHYPLILSIRVRSRLLEVNWFTRIHFLSSPIADPLLPIRVASPVVWRQRVVAPLVPKAGTRQGTFFAA